MKDFSAVNPYFGMIDSYPGRIFSYESPKLKKEGAPSAEELDASIRELAKSANTVICEFGSGSGRHCNELASQNPKAVVIGFELRYKRAVRTMQKAEEKGVENVYVVRTRAEDFVRIFPEKSIDAVYVNFPDPWAKKKQKKHRLLSENFFSVLPKFLKPDAYFSFKTDHLEYFKTTAKLIESGDTFNISEYTEDLYSSEFKAQSIETEFESLFFHQGLKINYLKALPI